MIKPDTLKILEELGQTQYGVALKEFLSAKEEESLQIMKTSKEIDELMAHQRVLALIGDLSSFMEPKKTQKTKTNEYE